MIASTKLVELFVPMDYMYTVYNLLLWHHPHGVPSVGKNLTV